ncbi:hypothetical protein RFI_28498 [Reticulomyxa filosa]|uniref:Uncharacterized protein n=1 Tax=Reticulomyxa filosa TaxID=46433 RepID=X6M4S2_RETFI|nr:hypothetical protein RFI_28498 [Reticulomyxa filosa]|eukprot:ETO08889.1 hypothetical protein RFI_28498 [Reticulomyxa filosa]
MNGLKSTDGSLHNFCAGTLTKMITKLNDKQLYLILTNFLQQWKSKVEQGCSILSERLSAMSDDMWRCIIICALKWKTHIKEKKKRKKEKKKEKNKIKKHQRVNVEEEEGDDDNDDSYDAVDMELLESLLLVFNPRIHIYCSENIDSVILKELPIVAINSRRNGVF